VSELFVLFKSVCNFTSLFWTQHNHCGCQTSINRPNISQLWTQSRVYEGRSERLLYAWHLYTKNNGWYFYCNFSLLSVQSNINLEHGVTTIILLHISGPEEPSFSRFISIMLCL